MRTTRPDDDLCELTDTGRILIRASESLEQFEKQLKNSQRLARWIRKQLWQPAIGLGRPR